MSSQLSTNEEGAQAYEDPFRKTCLVPYVDVSTAPPAVADKINVLPFRRNIFRLLGHSHGLFPHLMGIIGGCFNGQVRKIPLLDWQLIVLRTATILEAKYEYDVNVPVAEVYDLGQDKIQAMGCTAQSVVDGEGPWNERQRLILRVVDEQLATYSNDPQTIQDALKVLSVEDLVEVLIILGTYALIARVIRGLKIDDDQPIRPEGLAEMLKKSVTPTVGRD
ncbi:hypothetical protein BDV97DRAFT_399135 [Delphinella strobiligena]|nr:hypothetical protein BDV97DRAFT_399135 [Delphinella strobiligena]